MITIGFIRHGVTAWNKEGRAQGSSDIPLDEEGIAMAERVAARLAEEQWDVIYTSPLSRARMTAEIIGERMPEVPMVLDDRIRETGGGKIEGTTETERIEKWGPNWRELDMGFEPHDEVISRGLSCIKEVQDKFSGKRVLLVSHGSFIKRLLHELVPEADFDQGVDNTSVTILTLGEAGNHCSLFNCTTHLKAVDA
ncbi:histidine phosphatase family protein [Sporosarcina sp. Te-1]|uniref:histidine phosphatase family protein n=1 Tax=Sporosarcina sp. Te-1 TaxID=2818390 RepID=UPI001A9DC511|nr:histidine phosphatase family protein [Sporosarcina sp. Te-1]QTD42654.1 histidine phosphatase family protein [Sporosarcina sp. Te-1]